MDRFIGYIVFAGRRHEKIIEFMMLIEITGEGVKFIGSVKVYIQDNLLNMSLQPYISYLSKHSHFITFHFVYYDQSTP